SAWAASPGSSSPRRFSSSGTETGARVSGPRSAGSGRRRDDLLVEPGLSSEVPVLLGAKPVRETPRWEVDVVVGEHFVLGDVPAQPAALDEALGEVTPGAHLVGVDGFAVGHELPVVVEGLAGAKVPLRQGAHLDHGPAERRR